MGLSAKFGHPLGLNFGPPLVENDGNYIDTWAQVTQFDLKIAEYTTWGTSDKGENRNEQGKVKATEPQGIQSVDHWGREIIRIYYIGPTQLLLLVNVSEPSSSVGPTSDESWTKCCPQF